MSSGLTYTPGMYADTDELAALCRVVAAARRLLQPAHPLVRRGCAEAYAEMLDRRARHRLPRAPDPRHHELRPRTPAGPASCSRWSTTRWPTAVDITLDTYPYLPGCTTLSRAAAELVLGRWPRRPAGPAGRPGDRGRGSPTNSRSVGTDGCHGVHRRLGHHPDQRGRQPRPGGPVGPHRRRARRAAGAFRHRGVLRPAASRTSWPRRSCSTSVTRTTCRRSCSTASHWAAATGSSSATGRIRGPGAPSRATWPATPANSACSVWTTASHHLTGRPAARLKLHRPRPGPRGIRRRPGAVRPRHGAGHRHLRGAAATGARNRLGPGQRRAGDRGRRPHRRPARPGAAAYGRRHPSGLSNTVSRSLQARPRRRLACASTVMHCPNEQGRVVV